LTNLNEFTIIEITLIKAAIFLTVFKLRHSQVNSGLHRSKEVPSSPSGRKILAARRAKGRKALTA